MTGMPAERSLIEQLRSRATAAESVVDEVRDWHAVATLALELAGDEQVAVTPSLLAVRPGLAKALGDRLLMPDHEQPFASIADVAVGILEGVLAVAESGSVLLAHYALADRAVSMLARTCLHVVEAGSVVPTLDEAAAWLDQHASTVSLMTLATGPSRTADIERSLTIGVQGPSDVRLVLVG